MATAEQVKKAAEETEVKRLRAEIGTGSSWAALVLAVKLRPASPGELARAARTQTLPTPGRRIRAFDACVDGYAVFEDGRRRGVI